MSHCEQQINGEKKIDRVLLNLILLYYAECDTVPLMMGKVLYNVLFKKYLNVRIKTEPATGADKTAS